MDQNIQSYQELFNKLKVDHAAEISQLESTHLNQLSRLNTDHEQELIRLKKRKPCTNLNTLDRLIEIALSEFEQEQYNVPFIVQHDCNSNSLQGKFIPAMKNQQWYSKQYIPVNAMSWPAPQLVPNLKKLHHHTR